MEKARSFQAIDLGAESSRAVLGSTGNIMALGEIHRFRNGFMHVADHIHYYTPEEIDRALQRPVVQSLFEFIRFRNRHPAFDGAFSLPETGNLKLLCVGRMELTGRCKKSFIRLSFLTQCEKCIRWCTSLPMRKPP